MNRIVALTFALVLGCGGAARSETRTTPAPSSPAATGQCAGWVPVIAPGGTRFAFPTQGHSEVRGNAAGFQHSESDVYYEVLEQVFPGLEGGSDRAAIQGVLAAPAGPPPPPLDTGWSIVSRGESTFAGRLSAETVYDIQGQVVRTERMVRAGPTFVRVVTMVRHDRAAANAAVLRCFESSFAFAAPPSS